MRYAYEQEMKRFWLYQDYYHPLAVWENFTNQQKRVVEILRRTGDQVKAQGFSIEQGEVGTLLVQHPSVRETVVILRFE